MTASSVPQILCKSCGNTCPLTPDYFQRDKSRPDGFRHTCKPCVKEKSKARYWSNPEHHRAYARERRKKDPEAAKAKQRAYWHRTRETRLQQSRESRVRHLEKRRAGQREYRIKNAELVKTKQLKWREQNRERARQATQEWRENNRERDRANAKHWAETHREQYRRNMRKGTHHYRTRKKNAEGSYTAEDIQLLHRQSKGLCWWCGETVDDNYHVDHRIPLSRGGTNSIDNLCISCPQCNQSKSDKLPHEWNGRLL